MSKSPNPEDLQADRAENPGAGCAELSVGTAPNLPIFCQAGIWIHRDDLKPGV